MKRLPEREIPIDKPNDHCGVVGIFTQHGKEIAQKAYYASFGQQHRGQSGASIVVSDGRNFYPKKGLGLMLQVFHDSSDPIWRLNGCAAVSFVRYPTQGLHSSIDNLPPLEAHYGGRELWVASNGHLVNYRDCAREIEGWGIKLASENDSEIIAQYLAHYLDQGQSIVEAVRTTYKKLAGAYSAVVMTDKELIAIRDPHGLRPLSIGSIKGGWAVASETVALSLIKASRIREVKPGWMVVMGEQGIRKAQYADSEDIDRKHCIFELVYISRPESFDFTSGKEIFAFRKELGRLLAQRYGFEADIVVPIPDTGYPAASGYANESGIPLSFGFGKSRYIFRTFIQPEQKQRIAEVKLKLTAIPSEVRGKRVLLVDDSIVRGTTTYEQGRLLRQAGAKEVCAAIHSMPYVYPCFMGVDTPDRHELAANRWTIEEYCKTKKIDGLGYLTREDMEAAVGVSLSNYCCACFDGEYPNCISQWLHHKK